MHSPHAPRHSKKYTPINSRNLLKIKLPAPFRCASSAPNPRFLIVQRVTFFRVLFGLVTDCNDYIVWEKMIKGIIIVNNHGKPRLVKFYQSVESEALQQTVIRRVFTQVAQRPDSFCNYLEGIVPEWGEHIKLIYRHYATLYFVFAVDAQESDLGILDLIQVFVEALDKVCKQCCNLFFLRE